MTCNIGPARCSCRADLEPGALACQACGLLVTAVRRPVRGSRPVSKLAVVLGSASGGASFAPFVLSGALYLADSAETARKALEAFWVCAPLALAFSGLAVWAAHRHAVRDAARAAAAQGPATSRLPGWDDFPLPAHAATASAPLYELAHRARR